MTLENFVSSWQLDFVLPEETCVSVKMPYIVESVGDGEAYFFEPSDLCKHALLRPVSTLALCTLEHHTTLSGCALFQSRGCGERA